jgi:MurNAc alpha-1-phosphate uridylyltransferase
MKAIVLAAGRGERMRPLTDQVPKPLLPVHGKPLIEWHLAALARAGVHEVVINTAWLEEQIVAAIGDGSRYGLRIAYSLEGHDHGGALETAGGIAAALPLLAPRGDECFWVVSADIFAPGFEFDMDVAAAFGRSNDLAHLWMVHNPAFHSAGDFHLDAAGRARRAPADPPREWTYANIALLRPELLHGIAAGQRAALGPLLFDAADRNRVGARILAGAWENVGTPEQLAQLNAGGG